jgi:diadenylate cyclase
MNWDFLNLGNFIRAIGVYGWWRVSAELLVIGLFVYAILRFLRGTRGARMIKGIGFLLVVLHLTVRLLGAELGLERLSFLYSQFLLFASFATVVVFQPEIRRALMRLGETRLFRKFSHPINEDIDAIVTSAIYLARRKVGALIAIEREVGLGGVAEGGTRLNADLCAPLLNTIFWPNSPLHDLGVVISGGRIMYAGVQFPLAEGEDFDRELGSRHRAAVGMSQESDAVIVVVSEETGDISLAEKGRLIRKISGDELRDLLMELLGRQTKPGMMKAA